MDDFVPQSGVLHLNQDPEPRKKLSFRSKNIRTLLPLFLVLLALPVTILFAQQTQIFKQRASEQGIECRRCSNTNLGKMAIFRTNDACGDATQAAKAGPIPGTAVKYEDSQVCLADTSAVCTFDKLSHVPDWAKGNDSLGNGDFCGQVAGQTKPAACGSQSSGWITGPRMEAGAFIGLSGKSPNWAIPLGGKLPVAYDAKNDITRHEYNGKTGESNWSRFLRRLDDSYFATYASQVASNQISTGAIIKYEILRVARDSVHTLTQFRGGDVASANQQIQEYKDGKLKVTIDIRDANGQSLKDQAINPQLLSRVTGFDVTGLDLTQWSGANDQERASKMITETSSCQKPIQSPSTPVTAPSTSVPVSQTPSSNPSTAPSSSPSSVPAEPVTGIPGGIIGKFGSIYYSPSAIEFNGKLYAFVIGEGAENPGKTTTERNNVYVTSSVDGITWTPYQNLGGNIVKPLEILKSGTQLTLFGTFPDFNVRSKKLSTGTFESEWSNNTYTPGVPPYDGQVISNNRVNFQNKCYIFSTVTGELKLSTTPGSCINNDETPLPRPGTG